MLRTRNVQPSLWDAVLPEHCGPHEDQVLGPGQLLSDVDRRSCWQLAEQAVTARRMRCNG
jgi:hypothetical protein